MSILIDLKCGDPDDAAARYQLAGYAEAYACPRVHGLLTFDADAHVYTRTDTGEVVPSVTQILKATGVSMDFEDLSSFGSRIRQAVDVKREIGTAVHLGAHAFDDDDLDWSTVHPEVEPYLMAWAEFRKNYPHLRPLERERLLYHPGQRYAGTMDGVFSDGQHENIIKERWSVQLTPGKKIPYRVTAYTDWTDFQVWQAIVTTYWAGHAQRKAQ